MTEPTRPSELENIVVLDLETSGLDEQNDQILEVAAVFGGFVDGAFVERCRTSIVLPIMSNVEDWHPVVLEMHTKNGLFVEAMAERKRRAAAIKFCRSPKGAYEETDSRLVQAAPLLPSKQKWALLGNSVHFDLRFVRRCFPSFAGLCSHRVIDVSSIRLFCESLGRPYVKGEVAHRAMADVEASLAEYATCQEWIRDHFTHAGAVEHITNAFRDDMANARSVVDPALIA